MASSLSNLANNLAEGIHKVEPKYRDMRIKNAKDLELNNNIVSAVLNTQT